MHLVEISGRAFQGDDFKHSLERANLLYGDNFAGKSKVLNAVRLLLIGHLPELGKKPVATFGLASGPSMEVAGVLRDGLVDYAIRRRWWLEGDSVKSAHEVPDAVAACGLLTVMLNAEEYFGLSDRDRVAYVAANVPGAPAGIGPVDARIEKAAPGYKFSEVTKDLDHECELLEFIDAAITAVAEDWKKEKDHAKRMEQTIQGLTGLRMQDAAHRPLAEAQNDRARVERATSDVRERKGVLMARFTKMRGDGHRRGQIKAELGRLQKDRQDLVDLVAKRGLLAEKAAIQNPAPDLERAFLDVVEAQTAHKRLNDETLELAKKHLAIDAKWAELDGRETCPYCGAAGDGWKALRSAEVATEIGTIEVRQAELRDLLTAAAAAVSLAKERHENAKAFVAELDALRREREKVDAAIAGVQPRIARAEALEEEQGRLEPEDAQLTAAVETLQTEENLMTAEARALDGEVGDAQGRAAELGRLAKAETERDEAKKSQDAAAAAGKELRLIQAEVVEGIFRPLLETANAIFGAVLPTPLAYRAGEIGTVRAGAWVGHRTFSGTEKALAYAAIQAALAARSPVKIMLLDELGRLTRANASLAAQAVVAALAAGHIDQFIGVDPERDDIYAEIAPKGPDLAFKLIEVS